MKSITLILILLFSNVFSQEITISTLDGDLIGTFLKAENEKDIAVLFISGSGPTDRNGNSPMMGGSNNSLKMLAEEIAKKGYSSLRYDKRMVGASQGFPGEAETGFNDFIDDAVAAANQLKKLGYERIVIAGHSEGSLIGTIAAKRINADGFISLCGLAKKGSETIVEQVNKNAPHLVDQLMPVIDSLNAGKKVNEVPPILMSLFRPSIQNFLIEFFALDPANEISKLDVPCLIISGKTDIQVNWEDGRLLSDAAKSGEHYPIEGMNHIFKDVSGDVMAQLSSYKDPNLPVNQELVTRVVEFLNKL